MKTRTELIVETTEEQKQNPMVMKVCIPPDHKERALDVNKKIVVATKLGLKNLTDEDVGEDWRERLAQACMELVPRNVRKRKTLFNAISKAVKDGAISFPEGSDTMQ